MKDIAEYAIRVCVFGSRSYNNYQEFCSWLRDYVSWLSAESLCFVSGAAKNGPDAMIIRWCKENNYPCYEYPADWDNDGKAAGFIRNRKMRGVTTHALGFWDGVSRGTEEMIEGCMAVDIKLSTIIVTPDTPAQSNFVFVRKKFHNGRKSYQKPQGSGSSDPFRFRGNTAWKRKR